MSKRLRVCDHAVNVLRETNNPAVMWGDHGLLTLIAKRANTRTQGRAWKTPDAILNTLAKTPGDLVPSLTFCHHRWVRIFYLPEKSDGVIHIEQLR